MAALYLLAAVAGNILSNVLFKAAVSAAPERRDASGLLAFGLNPYLWGGLFAAGIMLAFYLLAVREIGLSVTYAFVTSLSLVGITLVAAITFKEAVSVQSVLGVALVVAGIFLISSAGWTAGGVVPASDL